MQTQSFYETDLALGQYLLFHYGHEADVMPYPFGPKEAMHFPVRCVTECLPKPLPEGARALELGCAVGRSCFELSRYCEKVVGVDSSAAFISAAQQIQQAGHLDYFIKEEGCQISKKTAHLPSGVCPDKVLFAQADATAFVQGGERFDIVLAANLICRLQAPKSFLFQLKNALTQGGQLILTTPYSWMESYTPVSEWLGVGSQAEWA